MDSIDDNEELEYTEDAFNVLGFSEQEKFDCYMLTAGKYNRKNRSWGGDVLVEKPRTSPLKAS